MRDSREVVLCLHTETQDIIIIIVIISIITFSLRAISDK